MSNSTKLTPDQLEAAENALLDADLAFHTKPLTGGWFSFPRVKDEPSACRNADQLFDDFLHDRLANLMRECLIDQSHHQREEAPLDCPETVRIAGPRLIVEWPGNPNRYDLQCVERVAAALGFNSGVHAIGKDWCGFGRWRTLP